MNLPIVLPSFPEARPRLLILIYCLKSFLSHVGILYRILFFNIRLLMPYVRSISQYLMKIDTRLTFHMPLFTSISSVYFLSISGSVLFLFTELLPISLYRVCLKSLILLAKCLKVDIDICLFRPYSSLVSHLFLRSILSFSICLNLNAFLHPASSFSMLSNFLIL